MVISMVYPAKWLRQPTRCVLLILGWAAVSFSWTLHAAEAVVAVPRGLEQIELVQVEASGVTVSTVLGAGRWHAFGLRDPSEHAPQGAGQVVEVGPLLPRLAVRGTFQLVACSSATESALAALGSWGVSVLRRGGPQDYVPDEEGSVVSESGDLIAVSFAGAGRERIVLVDVRGERPLVTDVELPSEVTEVEGKSLSIISGALLFLAETGRGDGLYRVPFSTEPELTLGPTERVAVGLEETERGMATGSHAAAFLAGPDDDELDVYVVRATGGIENVTRLPGPYLRHRPDDQHLAIDPTGKTVAYSLENDGEPEAYLHDVQRPGLVGRVHITSDRYFNPYIDQEVFIVFDASDRLVFAAGHSEESTDVFRVQGLDVAATINLTRTGSTLEAPFLTRGALAIERAVTVADLALLSSSGFEGAGTGLVVVSLSSGATLYRDDASRLSSDFVRVGDELYFVGVSASGGLSTLYKAGGSNVTAVEIAVTAGSAKFLAAEPDLAFAALPGRGIYLLAAGDEPRRIIDGDALHLTAFDSQARVLLYSELWTDGGRGNRAWDLDQGISQPFGPIVGTGSLLVLKYDAENLAEAVSPPQAVFLRGDANHDGSIDLGDPLVTLSFLFRGAGAVTCLDAADTDDDGNLSIADALRTLRYLFAAALPPLPPFPLADADPTPDTLGCVER